MSVQLRAHHLLCILTFIGKGYTRDFTENHRALVLRINAGEEVEIVHGPDDICAPLEGLPEGEHCLNSSVCTRDEKALASVGLVLGRALEVGHKFLLSASDVTQLRKNFAADTRHAACAGCNWAPLCNSIAADGFNKTHLVDDL
ncbi:DUF1284 domain-containing protein [Flexibacterium corallicola]|uniref:DUF1284 domain-containing protein n=1 Tax=Flexibacterium corallicola TaxID=3037259 RepID=UPI00286F768F|nr:DUF1284 domain-containing protein [Pseudovibrio sp. M1P-2-3]